MMVMMVIVMLFFSSCGAENSISTQYPCQFVFRTEYRDSTQWSWSLYNG